MNCSGIDVETGELIAVEFDETIRAIQVVEETPDIEEDAIWIAPGFVDIQVNGFAGFDFNDPEVTVGQVATALNMIVTTGVTRCLPTVITGSPHGMLACLTTLRKAQLELPNAKAIAGFHVEGPYIGADDGPRGAHPLQWVRKPDIAEYHRWQEVTDHNVRLVTLSPHYEEAPDFIRAVVADGCTISIGHTGATAEQIAAAVDAGATLSTHLGNGAHKIMMRHPNYLWDQLAEDRLSASFIVDGIHVGRAFLRTALRAKTVERSVLVTDASAPAGTPPGRYKLGEQYADHLEDGRVVLAGTDKLAGSSLKMSQGVANLVQLGGLSLRDAVQMATVNPARIVNLEGRQDGLSVGERGDVVLFRFRDTHFRDSLEIVASYVDGQQLT